MGNGCGVGYYSTLYSRLRWSVTEMAEADGKIMYFVETCLADYRFPVATVDARGDVSILPCLILVYVQGQRWSEDVVLKEQHRKKETMTVYSYHLMHRWYPLPPRSRYHATERNFVIVSNFQNWGEGIYTCASHTPEARHSPHPPNTAIH